jgi:hypothetical protein
LIENNTLWMNENGKSFDFEDDWVSSNSMW